ncbi:hypothetical protein [Enterococcus faecium]|uniref:hypothetical protein n=1 Tax=Enterococcus faecium TaxID=1352 RepID=UPI0039FC96BA
MFSAKNIVLLTEINGFFDASLLHNYMDVIKKKKVSIHFKYFIPISIAKKVEILYLPLTLASLANVVSILIDNKLR